MGYYLKKSQKNYDQTALNQLVSESLDKESKRVYRICFERIVVKFVATIFCCCYIVVVIVVVVVVVVVVVAVLYI